MTTDKIKRCDNMEYTKCLVELDEVLCHLIEDDLKKIPENIRNSIKKEKDKNYIWKYDESKELKEQNLDRKTIAILSYLNMEYLLNDEQKELMEKFHKANEQKTNKEKQEEYNTDNILKKEVQSSQDNLLTNKITILENKKSFFEKILNKIKNFFRIK